MSTILQQDAERITEVFAMFSETLRARLQPVAESLLAATKKTNERWISFVKNHPEIFDPYYHYRLANYPHGKSIRGFKKWRKMVAP